jgi:hypothetical protein
MNETWREILRRWLNGSTLGEHELAELESLKQADPAGYREILPYLPFMRRESGGSFGSLQAHPDLTGRIMAFIERETLGSGERSRNTGERRIPRAHSLPRVWLRALQVAVPMLVLVAGFMLGLGYARSSAGNAVTVSPDTIVVTFRLAAPEASQVALVGDFNDWQPTSYELKEDRDNGIWEISVPLKRGQVYTYNFLINGNRWISDPDSLYQVKDGFGGEKSVIQL